MSSMPCRAFFVCQVTNESGTGFKYLFSVHKAVPRRCMKEFLYSYAQLNYFGEVCFTIGAQHSVTRRPRESLFSVTCPRKCPRFSL